MGGEAPSASLRISARGSDAAQTPQLRLRRNFAVLRSCCAQDDGIIDEVLPHKTQSTK